VVMPPPRTLCRARISSLATYVPPRVLTNADLERMVDTSDEWILQRTGIRERHIVDPGVATSDLAVEAARTAIERAGPTPSPRPRSSCPLVAANTRSSLVPM
jgi:3-oxoacyl-[acyl-carrier-protein] synthase-3